MTGQAATAPSFDAISALLENSPGVDSPLERISGGSVAPVESDHAIGGPTPELDALDTGNPGPTTDDLPQPRLRDTSGQFAAPAKRTSQTFEVTVKGDDGKESKLVVDHAERGAGYLRHADYTRKTQELSQREAKATELVENKLSQGMQQAAQATNFAMAAINRLADFKTPEQMLAMAQSNPQAHQQELARVSVINGVLNELAGQMNNIKQAGEAQAKEAKQRTLKACWDAIRPEGIDEAKLKAIFEDVAKRYAIAPEKFARLDDPALVFLMRDSMELHALKAQANEVRSSSNKAPTQTQRQLSSRAGAGRQDFADTARRNGGRASIRDLAGFIANMDG